MNLTVPREHLFEQSNGTWWFVVYGVDPLNSALGSRAPNKVPPPQLVALAAPCETCCGSRLVWLSSTSKRRARINDPDPGLDAQAAFTCPDCADRTLTIETDCPNAPACIHQNPKPGAIVVQRCQGCHGNGTVSLGPFRIETPVPIMTSDDERGCLIVEAVYLDDGEPYHWAKHNRTSWSGHTIDLGSDPARFVGLYAVKTVTA